MTALYPILVVVTGKNIQALSIESAGRTRPVSIEGNPFMVHKRADDMARFVSYIKYFYNINNFSDDDFAILIVNCGADGETAEKLYTQFTGARDCSMINAEYVIPVIAAKKRKIGKNDSFPVRVFGVGYTIRTDDKGRAFCERQDAEADNALTLETADFTALFALDIGAFGADEEALEPV